MRSPDVLPRLFHAGGRADLHERNARSCHETGIYSLQVAFEGGVSKAGVDCGVAQVASSGCMSPNIYAFIKKQALARSDWLAMATYLDCTLRTPQPAEVARESYLLAKHLSSLLRLDDQPVNMASPLRQYERPWKLLHDAANQYLSSVDENDLSSRIVQQDLNNALHDGIYKWNDPRAARMLLEQKSGVKRYSSEWLSLMTQSAMSCDAQSCFELGKYYLEKDGWRPAQGAAKGKSRLGLEWIELGAALSTQDPEQMTKGYLFLALLLREHGFADEGLEYLVAGKESLEGNRYDLRGEKAQYLQSFEDHWNDDQLIVARSDELMD